jgi:adenine phosphoribosyltransferase
VPNFPTQGILFKDITPLLRDAQGFNIAVEEFAKVSDSVDIIAGVEARGFIFAAAVAKMTGKGFVPIRKSGKLPAASFSESYTLEYGESVLQIHQDAIKSGERVMLLDDVLATGGTLGAAAKLVARCGGIVDSIAVLMEISGLGGAHKFSELNPNLAVRVLLN